MKNLSSGRVNKVYKFNRADGSRWLIDNAAELDNPPDHVADKWYALPYPVPPGAAAGEAFDAAEAAEHAARPLG